MLLLVLLMSKTNSRARCRSSHSWRVQGAGAEASGAIYAERCRQKLKGNVYNPKTKEAVAREKRNLSKLSALGTRVHSDTQ